MGGRGANSSGGRGFTMTSSDGTSITYLRGRGGVITDTKGIPVERLNGYSYSEVLSRARKGASSVKVLSNKDIQKMKEISRQERQEMDALLNRPRGKGGVNRHRAFWSRIG